MSGQPILFIDRDGTMVEEPPIDKQLDSLEKLAYEPGLVPALLKLQAAGYRFVMVTNQDGLGTASFPEDTFWPVQNFILKNFENEGIRFNEIFIDRSFPQDNTPTRKPETGMLTNYLNNADLAPLLNCDRFTHLTILDLSNTKVTAKNFKQQIAQRKLPALEKIILSGTPAAEVLGTEVRV